MSVFIYVLNYFVEWTQRGLYNFPLTAFIHCCYCSCCCNNSTTATKTQWKSDTNSIYCVYIWTIFEWKDIYMNIQYQYKSSTGYRSSLRICEMREIVTVNICVHVHHMVDFISIWSVPIGCVYLFQGVSKRCLPYRVYRNTCLAFYTEQ